MLPDPNQGADCRHVMLYSLLDRMCMGKRLHFASPLVCVLELKIE